MHRPRDIDSPVYLIPFGTTLRRSQKRLDITIDYSPSAASTLFESRVSPRMYTARYAIRASTRDVTPGRPPLLPTGGKYNRARTTRRGLRSLSGLAN